MAVSSSEQIENIRVTENFSQCFEHKGRIIVFVNSNLAAKFNLRDGSILEQIEATEGILLRRAS